MLLALAVGRIALADPEEPATIPAAPISTPEAAAAPLTGPQVYNAVCIACHAPPGVGGAPTLADSDAWAARIAQGMDILVDHALHGFTGSTGIMPRKGERVDLSDEGGGRIHGRAGRAVGFCADGAARPTLGPLHRRRERVKAQAPILVARELAPSPWERHSPSRHAVASSRNRRQQW
jgi:cytochrome c5